MCGVNVTSQDGEVLSVRPNPDDVWSRGHICPKGTTLGDLHHDPDRVRRPLIRDGSEFHEVSWDAAFERLESLASQVRERHGPDAFAAYGGNMAGKDATLSRYSGLLFRASGITRIFSSSTVDQHPKNVSALLMFGNEWRIPIPDVDRTDLFVILGGNPAASKGSIFSHRDVMGAMRDIRKRGGRVIVVDPVRTATAQSADQWIGVRPGADAALLLAIIHVLFASDKVRLRHLEGRVAGLDVLREVAVDFPPSAVAEFCGIGAEVISDLALQIAQTDRAAIYGRIGLCTQEFGTLSCWLIDALAALTGNLDRAGGSMWSAPVAPLVDMLATLPPGMPLSQGRSRVRGVPAVLGQFPASCMAEEIDTPGEGQIKALLTMAANPVLSAPGSERLAAALPMLECMVSLDNYVNETTRHAHVILPSPSFLETPHFDMWSWVFSLTSGGHYSPPLLPTPERPEHWRVVAKVGAILGGQPERDVDDMDDEYFAGLAATRGIDPAHALAICPVRGPKRILDLAIRTGPHGDRFGEVPGGLSLADFEDEPNGKLIGVAPPRAAQGFETPSGKIELAPPYIVADVSRLKAAMAAPRAPLVLVSRRHLRSMNSWMHNVPTLVRGRERCTLQIHHDDARERGILDGDRVVVASSAGAIEVPAELTADIRPGVVTMPHGWGHAEEGARLSVARTRPGANTNVLSPGELVDAVSGNAVLNGIEITVSKAGGR